MKGLAPSYFDAFEGALRRTSQSVLTTAPEPACPAFFISATCQSRRMQYLPRTCWHDAIARNSFPLVTLGGSNWGQRLYNEQCRTAVLCCSHPAFFISATCQSRRMQYLPRTCWHDAIARNSFLLATLGGSSWGQRLYTVPKRSLKPQLRISLTSRPWTSVRR
jgi:hypothetical protein